MDLTQIILGLFLIASASINVWLILKAKNQPNHIAPLHEIKYFEYVEESSGVVKNSRKYSIKGQIYFHGLPIGAPFVVSEHIIEEFSWDKFSKIRSEILTPLISIGIEIGSAMPGIGGAAKNILESAVKTLKTKTG